MARHITWRRDWHLKQLTRLASAIARHRPIVKEVLSVWSYSHHSRIPGAISDVCEYTGHRHLRPGKCKWRFAAVGAAGQCHRYARLRSYDGTVYMMFDGGMVQRCYTGGEEDKYSSNWIDAAVRCNGGIGLRCLAIYHIQIQSELYSHVHSFFTDHPCLNNRNNQHDTAEICYATKSSQQCLVIWYHR